MTTEADAHVIDDDQAVRESIEFLLRSAQLTVKTYETASAFLAVAPTVGSGCIITDVRMPGISGIDLLRRARRRTARRRGDEIRCARFPRKAVRRRRPAGIG